MKRSVLLGSVVLLLALGWASYRLLAIRSELVVQSEMMESSWQTMNRALDSRSNALSSLVELVRGHAPGEEKLYRNLEAARGQLHEARTPAEKIVANRRLDLEIAHLLLLAEGFPKLIEKDGYRAKAEELANAENNLAEQRRRYNEAVQEYNKKIDLFPDNIAAQIFGFARNEAYFNTARDLLVTPATGKR